MSDAGYLDGADMAGAFRLLRPNNLIWHYVMHSYLYGEELPPSDVLFWNCDTTRMPAAMHEFYLRELYLNNRLMRRAAWKSADAGSIWARSSSRCTRSGAEQDHIAPWKQTFRLCGLTGGPARYVLATSGHILGIINPPVDAAQAALLGRRRHRPARRGNLAGQEPKKRQVPGGKTGRAGWANAAGRWDRRHRSATPTIRPWRRRRGGMYWKNEKFNG